MQAWPSRDFFMQIVKWITLARQIPGHSLVYRAARADFNVRGWQGRLRYTAPTALFFYGGCPARRPEATGTCAVTNRSSQAGDLRFKGIAC
jgi:hypothetical protein